ncbi:hypothetical protein LTR17_016962 [Elasticomyces elasticus]|nr:hypothetical protein LTR17_016962 [Elasticomyces elasticus]
MLLNLNPFRKRVQRDLRRLNADIRRPLQQAPDLSIANGDSVGTDVLYESLLPKGYIRLLTLLRADEATVYCELNTYHQQTAPRYDAISYCWGADTTSTFVVCNGSLLKVRLSVVPLFKACLLRDHPRRPIWVDAVCLNQDNADEKALQVPLMVDIYKRATRTLIWLGESDEYTEDTIIWMKAVTGGLKVKKTTKALALGLDLEELGIHAFGEEDWNTRWQRAHEYLSRPWFWRLWTMQEIVLSWDVQILCATSRFNMIPWNDLVLFWTSVSNAGGLTRLMPDISELRHGSGLSRTVDFIESTRLRAQRSKSQVSSLKDIYQDRMCQEPVDRIWGLLGLVSSRLGNRVRDAEIIDYSEQGKREYWNSYLAFTKILYACDREDFFYLIFDDIGRDKTCPLPSWCVDFDAPRRYSSFQTFRHLRAGFTGSGNRPAINSSLDQSTNTLVIEGFTVESVTQVTAECSLNSRTGSEADVKRSYGELSLFLRECTRLRDMATFYETGVQSAKALCSALFAIERPGDAKYSSAVLDALPKIERICEAYQRDEDLDSEVAATDIPERKAWTEAMDHMDTLLAACDNRRAFVTRQGRIGLGPPGLQAGDSICVILGVGPLFALRRVAQDTSEQGRFRLIGDAYIDGWMFGEAFGCPGRGPLQKLRLI